jgi:hypothetical protein
VVFPSITIELILEENDYPPFFALAMNGQPWWPPCHFGTRKAVEEYLAGPLVFPSPSRMDTAFARLVKEKRAEVLAYRYSELDYCDFDLASICSPKSLSANGSASAAALLIRQAAV